VTVTQSCAILRVLVHFGSWLLEIITQKYKKIKNITGAGKVTLHACIFNCGSNAIERAQKILEKMVGRLQSINKKLSYCWETVLRESMPRIAEMDVEMTT